MENRPRATQPEPMDMGGDASARGQTFLKPVLYRLFPLEGTT